MDLNLRDALSVLGVVGAGVIWLLRLEGRVNQNARDVAVLERSTEKQIHDAKQAFADAVGTIRDDLQYIRHRVDAALAPAARKEH